MLARTGLDAPTNAQLAYLCADFASSMQRGRQGPSAFSGDNSVQNLVTGNLLPVTQCHCRTSV